MSRQHVRRSDCPIASTLDIVGDRWSLVIVRDLINGKRRFSDFLASPERITTSVLTSRLSAMEQAGLVERVPYQQRPPRHEYLLTEKGRGLHRILQDICRWANRHLPDTWVPPDRFMEEADRPEIEYRS